MEDFSIDLQLPQAQVELGHLQVEVIFVLSCTVHATDKLSL